MGAHSSRTEAGNIRSALSEMKYIVLLALLVLTVSATDAHGCDMISMRVAPPKPGSAVHIAAVITGYDTVAQPMAAPSLRVRIQEVVDGSIQQGDAEIAYLFYGPDCSSTPVQRTELEKLFPIGTQVVALGMDAAVRSEGRPTVLVEMNRGGYVARIPQGVPRTRYGDLDFQRFDATPSRSWQFVEFEFDRVLVTLSKGSVSERVSRLKNLAYYSGFSGLKDPQQFYTQIVSSSGIPERQGRALREDFDRLLRKPH